MTGVGARMVIAVRSQARDKTARTSGSLALRESARPLPFAVVKVPGDELHTHIDAGTMRTARAFSSLA